MAKLDFSVVIDKNRLCCVQRRMFNMVVDTCEAFGELYLALKLGHVTDREYKKTGKKRIFCRGKLRVKPGAAFCGVVQKGAQQNPPLLSESRGFLELCGRCYEAIKSLFQSFSMHFVLSTTKEL